MENRSNSLLREGLLELRRRLPPGWNLSEPLSTLDSGDDAVAQVTAPGRTAGNLVFEVRARLDPKGVAPVVEAARSRSSGGPLIVISRYLSEATRARLRERDVGYLDLTGNVRIVMSKPGLFVETEGAAQDPDRAERPARSLRGAKAGRIVRALVDRKAPPGVRELAVAIGIDAGYVSRVFSYLDTEALITRVGHGHIERVDWPALLQRWAKDAPLESRGVVRMYLEPRGLSSLVARLTKSSERYAITGSLAAAAFTPLAPPRLAAVWMNDVSEASTRLGLRPAEAGANVLLLEPGDDGPCEGALQRDGAWYAAPSQVVADLLTSPGRGPAEAEALLDWMRTNEEAWRR